MNSFKEENYEKKYKDLELKGEYFEKKKFIKCKFINCFFEKTNFIACKFNECIFDKCIIIDCGFSQTVFDEVEFRGSKVFTINFSEIRDFHTKIKFVSSKVHYCTFTDKELIEFRVENSELYECDFINCKLEKSIWLEISLERVNFLRCIFKNADLSSSKNYLINAKENYLNKTKFSYPEISNSLDLIGVSLLD